MKFQSPHCRPAAIQAGLGRVFAGSNLEPLLTNGGVLPQVPGRAFEHDLAVAHDVKALGNVQRDRQLLGRLIQALKLKRKA